MTQQPRSSREVRQRLAALLDVPGRAPLRRPVHEVRSALLSEGCTDEQIRYAVFDLCVAHGHGRNATWALREDWRTRLAAAATHTQVGDLGPVREALAVLLASRGGQLRAREAYAALIAQGFHRLDIERARRDVCRICRIQGKNKGAVWQLILDWRQRLAMTPAERRAAEREEAQRAEAARHAALVAAGARPRPTALPPLRKPLHCLGCGCSIGERKPGEPQLCFKPLCREGVEAA